MNKPIKTKLCWNCEGSVSRIADNCPYCGVYLSPEAAQDQDDSEESPPLKKKSKPYTRDESELTSIPKAPYIPRSDEEHVHPEKASFFAAQAVLDPTQLSLFKAVYLPVLLLSTGAICLLFSLILLAFATDGKLTLQWEQDLWPMFALLSLPLIFFGWRSISES